MRQALRHGHRPGNSGRGITPALAARAPSLTAQHIQNALAESVSMKKAYDTIALCGRNWRVGADQFVVIHEAFGQSYCAVRTYPDPATDSQTRTQHQRIQKIPFAADIIVNRTVVIGAR